MAYSKLLLVHRVLQHSPQLLPNPGCSSPYIFTYALACRNMYGISCTPLLIYCTITAYCDDTAQFSLSSSTILSFQCAAMGPCWAAPQSSMSCPLLRSSSQSLQYHFPLGGSARPTHS